MNAVRFDCNTANLLRIRELVAVAAVEAGLPPAEADALVLAVDEACANVMRHGYPTTAPADAQLAVAFERTPEGISVTIEDFGRSFDPKRAPPLDPSARRGGGLGLFLIQKLTDAVEYEPGCPNRLTLVKRRQSIGR